MGYKNVLLFKETMTCLQWLCKLKRYLYYICSSSFEVILGRLQYNGVGGVSVASSTKIVHTGYNSATLANDIALIRLPAPVPETGEYPLPVSFMLLCV
jgi:hypothetical protein